MFKFNVGDRVKVLSSVCDGQALGYGYTMDMDNYVGNTYTISHCNTTKSGKIWYGLKDAKWGWDERLLRRTRKAKPAIVVNTCVEIPLPDAVPAAIIPAKEDNATEYKELVKELKTAPALGEGICAFGIAYTDKTTWIYPNAPCHYAIGGILAKWKEALLLDISAHLKSHPNEAAYREYCEYIFTKSPRANCFHYEGWEHAVENGIFMNVSRPIEELAGAAVALREGSEYPRKLAIFQKLTAKGYSGNVAYLLSYCVSEDLKWAGFNDAHKSINCSCSFKGIIRFFKEGYYLTRKLKPYLVTTNRYNGVSKWVSPESKQGRDNIDVVFSNLLGVPPNRGWDYEPNISEDNLLKAAEFLEKELS
jgi:hypothetical protein